MITVSKKFLFISLLLLGLTLTGCAQKMYQDDLFDKKQECASYKDDIQKEQIQGILVSEVFYSKKMNTCLYVLEGNGWKFIIDRFGNEEKALLEVKNKNNCELLIEYSEEKKKCLQNSEEFDKQLKELKGE